MIFNYINRKHVQLLKVHELGSQNWTTPKLSRIPARLYLEKGLVASSIFIVIASDALSREHFLVSVSPEHGSLVSLCIAETSLFQFMFWAFKTHEHFRGLNTNARWIEALMVLLVSEFEYLSQIISVLRFKAE